MKKILLGTTALVAAGLVAGPALASDPLKVTVGGNVVTGFYAINADNGPTGTKYASTKVAVVARNIDIIAEGTLDNGMTAGVDAKLMLGSDFSSSINNANTNGSATFRQLYAYLEGGFGRFEIGGTDGAAYKMHYTSPWFVPGNGVDSPNIYNSALSPVRASTFSLLATDSNKVSYFTPRLAGFQLGVSYTPDAGTNIAGGRNVTANGLGLLVQGGANATEVYEVAGNYSGSFSGVDLGLDAFYTAGNSGLANTNPTEYGFGTNIGFQGFTLGGAYYKSDDIANSFKPAAGRASKVWTVGLDYATGPWKVGAAYLNGKEDSSTVLAAGAAKKNSTWQVGGGYSLGSGVDVGLDLQLNSVDTYSQGSYDSKSAGLVLAVSF